MKGVPVAGRTVRLRCWCGCQTARVVARRRRRRFSVAACTECGTHQNYPRPVSDVNEASACYRESESFPERYSPDADRWARKYVQDMRLLLGRANQRLEDFDRVLDVGCGGGQLVKALRRRGVAAEGIDLDPKCIAFAKRQQPEGTFHVGHLAGLEAGPYEMVTGFHVLEHAPDPKKLAEQILRKLVPGGVFLGAVPNIASVSFSVLGTYWGFLAPLEHVTLFSPATLRRCLVAAGFERMEWKCAQNRLILPAQALRQLWQTARRAGVLGALRYSAWCTIENWARILTRLSAKRDAGEKLFFMAKLVAESL